jgi:hypothetical protein
MRTFAVTICISALCSTCIAQEAVRVENIQQNVLNATKKVAEEALITMKRLAANGAYNVLGFNTKEQALGASLGEGIPIFDIGTQELKAYTIETDPSRLLTICNRVVNPVLIDGNVKSSIAIVKSGASWSVGEFGRPTTASALQMAVKSMGGLSGPRPGFVALVPSQNLYLKGKFAGGGVQIRAVAITREQAETGPNQALFREGAPSGRDLLSRLSENAKRMESRRVLR